jgi:Cu+-exporting ATPase
MDPICGMTVAIAGAKHVADFGGRNYYFCCGGCLTKFLADPARHAVAGAASS